MDVNFFHHIIMTVLFAYTHIFLQISQVHLNTVCAVGLLCHISSTAWMRICIFGVAYNILYSTCWKDKYYKVKMCKWRATRDGLKKKSKKSSKVHIQPTIVLYMRWYEFISIYCVVCDPNEIMFLDTQHNRLHTQHVWSTL